MLTRARIVRPPSFRHNKHKSGVCLLSSLGGSPARTPAVLRALRGLGRTGRRVRSWHTCPSSCPNPSTSVALTLLSLTRFFLITTHCYVIVIIRSIFRINGRRDSRSPSPSPYEVMSPVWVLASLRCERPLQADARSPQLSDNTDSFIISEKLPRSPTASGLQRYPPSWLPPAARLVYFPYLSVRKTDGQSERETERKRDRSFVEIFLLCVHWTVGFSLFEHRRGGEGGAGEKPTADCFSWRKRRKVGSVSRSTVSTLTIYNL